MMRLAMTVLVLGIGLCSGCAVRSALRQPIPVSDPVGLRSPATEELGQRIQSTMRKHHVPGVSIAVIDGGQLVYAQGFGWRDVEAQLPVDTDTRFQAGSISKAVTGLGVLCLAESGIVDLDQDVNAILADWQLPTDYPESTVTLRHLLAHRAGTNIHGFVGYGQGAKLPTLKEVLDGHYVFGLNQPVKVVKRPNTAFEYSGGGYCVLQQAVEDAAGRPFDQVLAERILQPLGMTRSHFHHPPHEAEVADSAHGYGVGRGVYRGAWRVHPELAAAGLWSTPSDLARMILAVQAGNAGRTVGPITPGIARQYVRPQFEEFMGAGVFLDQNDRGAGFYHGGENWGYVSHFGADVTGGRGHVIMTNAQNHDAIPEIQAAIVQAFGWNTPAQAAEPSLPWIKVSDDGRGFVEASTGKPFTPWGFNYDHDRDGRLIEDYWHEEWPTVEEDFAEMKALGANVVRVHLQFAKFMDTPTQANEKNLARLADLLKLAERTGLYIDLTGLACYRKKDVPAWYDAMDQEARWAAQAAFWEAIAKVCADSPAIFCYDLMNEPVAPSHVRERGEWLGPPFAGGEAGYFVQWIGYDPGEGTAAEMAVRWIRVLKQAIRKHDTKHLISVGLVDWSLDVPNKLRSGFVPTIVGPELDFLCVHLYPEKGKLEEDMQTLRGFDVGKPVVIEETFHLKASLAEFRTFIDKSAEVADGWIGFYWGKTPAELKAGGTIGDAILLQWLEYFQSEAEKRRGGE